MDLETCLARTYCVVDEALVPVLGGNRLRQRGPIAILADSKLLAMEVVGEFLSSIRKRPRSPASAATIPISTRRCPRTIARSLPGRPSTCSGLRKPTGSRC